MSRKTRNDVAVAVIITALIITGTCVWSNHKSPQIDNSLGIDNGPPPTICYDGLDTPENCVVTVSAFHGDLRSYGHGVVVNYGGETFVLTSTMIFTEECDFVTIEREGVSQEVQVAYKDENIGLVALTGFVDYPSTSLNKAPSIPPGIEVVVGSFDSRTAEYIDEYWVVLDGELPADTAGMPVTTDNGQLLGVIVGRCSDGSPQSIMCANYGLLEFCAKVVEWEVVWTEGNNG